MQGSIQLAEDKHSISIHYAYFLNQKLEHM